MYKTREERNEFLLKRFGKYIYGNILNLGGGGEKYLEKELKKRGHSYMKYIEVDIAGNPDIKLNLEKELPLPFENSSFDTVIATDVLEHLDNLHEVFAEMVRVCKGYIIISLPNPLRDSLAYWRGRVYKNDSIERKKYYGKYMKFYGLPFEKPFDRHKWFFNYEDVAEFFNYQCQKYNLRLRELLLMENIGSLKGKLVYALTKLFFGEKVAKNINISAIWVILKKLK